MYTYIEIEMFNYINENIKDFNYANKILQLEDQNEYFQLTNDQKIKIILELQKECIDAMKNEIFNNNDESVAFLLLFQHMLFHKYNYENMDNRDENDGMEDLFRKVKKMFINVINESQKSNTLSLIKNFINHFLKNELNLKNNSIMFNLLELLINVITELLSSTKIIIT